jgi:acyl-CoA dehydrogenase
MDFRDSSAVEDLRARLNGFMEESVHPAEKTYHRQLAQAGDPHAHPPVMEELKERARVLGLWNLFLPDPRYGAGLTQVEFAPLAEITGRSPLAPEALNCAAPDTGNMEILAEFGTPEQQGTWLKRLLEGEIRSCFSMTEPEVASSDARNVSTRIEHIGDEVVINGRKWFSSGALNPRCAFAIVMGVSDPQESPYRRQSMVLVPLDTPGLTVLRSLTVFGYEHRGGHGEITFDNVRVPAANVLGGRGEGFRIAQARLGPGRIHHCMRAIGAAERAFELMCTRAHQRVAFGKTLAEQGVVQEWIAQARIKIEQARLLVLKTAWLIDTVGKQHARVEISAIKVAALEAAEFVMDKAIQLYGAAGVTQDFPLADMWATNRGLRIADGADEVHRMVIARHELARFKPAAG